MGNLGMRADKSPQMRRMRADRRRALWLRMLDNPGFLNSTRNMMTTIRRVASLHKEVKRTSRERKVEYFKKAVI